MAILPLTSGTASVRLLGVNSVILIFNIVGMLHFNTYIDCKKDLRLMANMRATDLAPRSGIMLMDLSAEKYEKPVTYNL